MKIIRIAILGLTPMILGFLLTMEIGDKYIISGIFLGWAGFIGFYVGLIGESV